MSNDAPLNTPQAAPMIGEFNPDHQEHQDNQPAIKTAADEDKRAAQADGVSLNDLQLLIIQKHRISVSADDPVLVQWTLLELFLEQYRKENASLISEQLKLFKSAFDQGGEKLEKSVLTALSRLSDESLNGSMQQHLSQFSAIKQEIDNQINTIGGMQTKIIDQLKFHRRFMHMITAINFSLLGLAIAIIYFILR